MTPEHFETVIRAFQRRAPFRSYRVELVSGSRVDVDHPEALVVRNGIAVFLKGDGTPVFFDHESAAQITDAASQRAA
jgi:hypothetical protein